MRILLSILTVILLFIAAVSCSSEKTNAISVSYHNTTARYNAYFIARERIREVESGIIENQNNNYDEILNIYPPLDSGISVTYAVQIEECLKKASIAIQNHPNSKWVDDSYVLVGLSRLYGYEHTHAIETFKYQEHCSVDVAIFFGQVHAYISAVILRNIHEQVDVDPFQAVTPALVAEAREPSTSATLR